MASSAKKRRTENSSSPDYAKSYSRVSKDNLYMIIALWMENFPEDVVDDASESHRKVGAVLVLPNDVIFAADCSRVGDGVHAVARLLMKHHDKAKGCKMFMSRKPCPFCAKLLVQSKVERVLFLPREPEYYRSPPETAESENDKKTRETLNESNRNQVDNMFTASAIAQTRFVLQVEEHVLADSTKKLNKEEADIELLIKDVKDNLTKKYGFNSKWIGSIETDQIDPIEKNLPWPAFDTDIKAEVMKYFSNAMNWMARAIALKGRELKFEAVNVIKKTKTTFDSVGNTIHEKQAVIEKTETTFDPVGNTIHEKQAVIEKTKTTFDPVGNTIHEKQASHFMTIARFLAERTDDPETGVGAVIVSPEMEILAFGWNGFPFKALYGEFARASKRGKSVDKKYPYSIHSEQNALLMRNEKNIKDAILFVTKSPCNECTPLIAMQGIKTVVVDDDVLARDGEKPKIALSYKKFPKMVKDGKFVCFQTKKRPADLVGDKARADLFGTEHK